MEGPCWPFFLDCRGEDDSLFISPSLTFPHEVSNGYKDVKAKGEASVSVALKGFSDLSLLREPHVSD